MKKWVIASAIASMTLLVNDAFATDPPVAGKSAAPIAAAATAAYSTDDTPIGDLLDDPKARAIIDKYISNFSNSDQIDAARGMTLKAVQPYATDMITDEVLAKIDTEFAALAKGK